MDLRESLQRALERSVEKFDEAYSVMDHVRNVLGFDRVWRGEVSTKE